MAKPLKSGATPILPLALCALIMVIDGYDLNAMPLVVPHLVDELGASPQQFSLALSAVLIGLGAGALLIAPLGDRIGRRPTILVAVAIMALTTLGTATGTTLTHFTLWRLATGLALGACLPNVTALVAEIAPQASRARTLTLVSMGIALGGVSAGLLAPLLVDLGGWQALFYAGGIATFALLAALMRWLPESARLQDDRASAPAAPTASAPKSRAFAQLLQPPLLASTAIFAGLYAINALVLYYLISWVPTVLPEAGFSVAAAGRFLSLIQFGGLLVGLGLALLLDRGRAMQALVGTYACVVLALVAMAVLPASPLSWGILLLIAGGGVSAAHLAIMAVAIGFFPSRLLSTAIGIAVAVARVGAIGGPFLGGAAITAGAGPGLFFAFAAIPAALCIVAALFIPHAQRIGRAADTPG
jgi:AAHS family 4-hydroxybenzoate transporter-like MFS transporter